MIMMRLPIWIAALLATANAADIMEVLTGYAETPLFLDASTTHYGDPKDGCMPDEQMFRIQGIEGDLCTPPCTKAGKCPADMPTGVTARPLCGLATPEGDKYCVLLCSVTGDSFCGAAKCRSVKGQPGIGICTYDVADTDDEEEGLAGAW